jgi:hypothetical protein
MGKVIEIRPEREAKTANSKSHAPKLYVSEPRGQGHDEVGRSAAPVLCPLSPSKSGASTAGQVPASRS